MGEQPQKLNPLEPLLTDGLHLNIQPRHGETSATLFVVGVDIEPHSLVVDSINKFAVHEHLLGHQCCQKQRAGFRALLPALPL